MATWREKVNELMLELQQERDELRVRAHLGKKELKEELAELDDKFEKVRARAAEWADKADDRMDDLLDDTKERTSGLMKEIKEGYDKLRDRLDKDDAAPAR